jgi:hypothetical protein
LLIAGATEIRAITKYLAGNSRFQHKKGLFQIERLCLEIDGVFQTIFRRIMVKGGLYFLKDDYFNDFPDPYLERNKEMVVQVVRHQRVKKEF